jgi:hypothetical protein
MWSTSLEIREAIRQFKINGGHPSTVGLPTKEQIALELLALARNGEVSDKERVNAYKVMLKSWAMLQRMSPRQLTTRLSAACQLLFSKK